MNMGMEKASIRAMKTPARIRIRVASIKAISTRITALTEIRLPEWRGVEVIVAEDLRRRSSVKRIG
jgi:hypothetical protein